MNFQNQLLILIGFLLPLLSVSLNSQPLACRVDANGEECIGVRAFLVGGLSANNKLRVELNMYPGNRIEVYSPSFQRLAMIRFGETGFALTSGMSAIQTFSPYPENQKHATNSKVVVSIGTTKRTIYVKMNGLNMAELPIVGIPYMVETDAAAGASKFSFVEGTIVSSSYCVVGNSSCSGTRMALLEEGFKSGSNLVIKSKETIHTNGIFSFGISGFSNYLSTPIFEIGISNTHILAASNGKLIANKELGSSLVDETTVNLQYDGSKLAISVNGKVQAELPIENGSEVHYLYQTASSQHGYSYHLE